MTSMITNKQTLVCPFCASTNLDIYIGYDFINHLGEESYVVECEACGALGPIGHSNDEAVQLWNDRWLQ